MEGINPRLLKYTIKPSEVVWINYGRDTDFGPVTALSEGFEMWITEIFHRIGF